jgi:hypothetical protein
MLFSPQRTAAEKRPSNWIANCVMAAFHSRGAALFRIEPRNSAWAHDAKHVPGRSIFLYRAFLPTVEAAGTDEAAAVMARMRTRRLTISS